MLTVWYFVLAALALGILVFIHELGHYCVAKWVGMTVETFSIGFGRPVLKWRFQEVDWQLGWLPFGGYVRIKGMELKKKDKKTYFEPHEIENGFFTKAPWKRIAVAIAGPVSNFILALLIFSALFLIGGREKPFAEFTHIVGYVDPATEAFAAGIRPGDAILAYDGVPFTTAKDHVFAAMLGDEKVLIEGEHINYATGVKTPFTNTIESVSLPHAPEGIRTTGITAGASYLIFANADSVTQNSPILESGIQPGDRLMWADGELLFSQPQLSAIINQERALLTVKRGDHTFLSRQPRVQMIDLAPPSAFREELSDWRYEAHIKTSAQNTFVLPYTISSDNVVQGPLSFIDEESEQAAFPKRPKISFIEQPLRPGDHILAVDGTPIGKGHDLLSLLQAHRVQLIVKEGVSLESNTPWKEVDASFIASFDTQAINALATDSAISEIRGYRRLSSVSPVAASTLASADLLERRMAQIQSIRDPKKRAQALKALEAQQKQLILGVPLSDRLVDFNPGPFALFKTTMVQTWQTLKALVMGNLNPKYLSGPVGIVQVIHHGWSVGRGEALFWIAAISLNLGFLNLLPIPVLDGGHICFSLWEWVTRKRIKAKTMERLIIPFVVLLFALFIYLTFQDLTRFF